MPHDYNGPNPSGDQEINIFLPRCRHCHKVLTETTLRYCSRRCGQNNYRLRKKFKDAGVLFEL